ncbi:MAG: helix-turn-helix domain-containing protein [Oscillospiraceae bacterium]|nr:helix-turn-helix domain-containing protein [Oscillospiraceae bacterium]
MSRMGMQIKGARESAGLTHEALAKKAGVSADFLRDVEDGKRVITAGHFKQIAKAVGRDLIDYTLGDFDEGGDAAQPRTDADGRGIAGLARDGSGPGSGPGSMAGGMDGPGAGAGARPRDAGGRDMGGRDARDGALGGRGGPAGRTLGGGRGADGGAGAAAAAGAASETWLDAFDSLLKVLPVFDYSLSKVLGQRHMPVISGKVDGVPKEKACFIHINDNDLMGFRVMKGDQAFAHVTKEFVNGGFFLVEYMGERLLRQIKKGEGGRFILLHHDGRLSTAVAASDTLRILARLIRSEVALTPTGEA